MSDLKYNITVDGELWTKAQLEYLEYERNRHVLHQLNRHGVEIKDGGKILSDDEIDYLTMEKAWDVSIETRLQYQQEKIIDLYQEDFRLSDAMWKALGFAQDKPMKVSYCNLAVAGRSLQEFMGVMKLMQEDDRVGLASHPEHFICHVSFDDGELLGIEPFGMYGTPTLVKVKAADISELGTQIQADRDNTFPMAMAAKAFLADGVTAVNSPFHQFKPTADGFETKTAVYWPEHTPDEIVHGHSLHLAMEFSRMVQLTGK